MQISNFSAPWLSTDAGCFIVSMAKHGSSTWYWLQASFPCFQSQLQAFSCTKFIQQRLCSAKSLKQLWALLPGPKHLRLIQHHEMSQLESVYLFLISSHFYSSSNCMHSKMHFDGRCHGCAQSIDCQGVVGFGFRKSDGILQPVARARNRNFRLR